MRDKHPLNYLDRLILDYSKVSTESPACEITKTVNYIAMAYTIGVEEGVNERHATRINRISGVLDNRRGDYDFYAAKRAAEAFGLDYNNIMRAVKDGGVYAGCRWEYAEK